MMKPYSVDFKTISTCQPNDINAYGISWKISKSWQIFSSDGCIYTPQSFEAKFGFLIPPPPSATKKTRKEWYAHRRKKTFKGFANKR